MARQFFGNPRMLMVGSQTDVSTASPHVVAGTGADMQVFPCEYEYPELDVAALPWASGTMQPGANAPPVAGRRSAKLKIRFPMHGAKSTYTVAAGAAADWGPYTSILGTMLGSGSFIGDSPAQWKANVRLASQAYAAAAVAVGSSTTAVNLDNGVVTGLTGKFFAVGVNTADVAVQFGWCKLLTTTGDPDVADLYEASKNIADAATDDIFASLTAYLSTNQSPPLTFRGLSGVANADVLLVGGYCASAEIMVGNGEVWWVTVNYEFADGYRIAGASALTTVTGAWYVIPPANSAGNGRFTYGVSGTGSATSIEGWKDVKIALESPIHWLEGPAGIQGYGTPALEIPKVKVTASICWDSADTVTTRDGGGEHALVTQFAVGTSVSICMSSGALPGKICSIFLPSLIHAKAPVPKAGDGGLLFHDCEFIIGDAIVDGTGTEAEKLATAAPANSRLRIGWA